MNFEQILNRVGEQLDFVLPPGMRTMRHELEKGLRSILTEALSKMDVVTREEFARQTSVLDQTRLRITELENRLKALEIKLRGKINALD